ncbi:MAG: leucine-rich repeat domain-containing protein [Solobacterium sp.]|nr:leucine-rich repeat domain-containing protein [Solobacterium sp.]
MPDSLFETSGSGDYLTLTQYRGHQTQAVIPDFISAIGENAFRRNLTLREVEIPGSVIVIGSEAFNGCIGLRKVVFHEGLQEIHMRAFWACSGIQELVFPRSLRFIDARAFEACVSLRKITFRNPETVTSENSFRETPWFRERLETAMKFMNRSDRISGSLTLPEGITHIDNWGFSGSLISTAWLPNSLRTVGMSAFKNCKYLTKVSMSPNSCCNYSLDLDPDDGIFSGCSCLEEVILRGSLTDYVWDGFEKPVLLRGFDTERTFLHCPSMKRIIAPKIPLTLFPEPWKRYALNGYLSDLKRKSHYLPRIAREYDAVLKTMRMQLIRRTESENNTGIFDYLLTGDLIGTDEIDRLIANAHDDAEIIARLIEYRQKREESSVFSLLDDI